MSYYYAWEEPFMVGDKVVCFAPDGWGGHQDDLMDRVSYSGLCLDEFGLPKHGALYCVRGFDHTCNKPAVYLTGVIGAERPDGSEMSFSTEGFMPPKMYRAEISKYRGF